MRGPLVVSALVSLLLFGLLACESPAATTPHARIERFTGCPVPSTAVQLHDHIGGDASGLRPDPELDFWTVPDRQVIRGGEASRAGTETVVLLHERDTDIAIYLYARRSGSQ